jgi:hypothetical protein
LLLEEHAARGLGLHIAVTVVAVAIVGNRRRPADG